MDELWTRIEAWLQNNAPEVASQLRPPANPSDIARLESVLQVTLPSDIRETYLRHDGSEDYAGWSPACLLPLKEIEHQWRMWKFLIDLGEFEGIKNGGNPLKIASHWYHPAWIPLTSNDFGDNHVLDLAPGPQGSMGQIVEMCHDEPARPVLASSFREWVTTFLEELEQDEWVFDPDEYNALVRREDLE